MAKLTVTFSIGDRFIQVWKHDSGEYILAQVNPQMVCLICLSTGNRFNHPVRVNRIHFITEEEMYDITARKAFILIHSAQ